jgi:hypothetical protein
MANRRYEQSCRSVSGEKHLLKCGGWNTRLRWDCSQKEGGACEHNLHILHIWLQYFPELLVKFYLMMAFQIMKLGRTGAIPPLILHAFVAIIEIILPHSVGYLIRVF